MRLLQFGSGTSIKLAQTVPSCQFSFQRMSQRRIGTTLFTGGPEAGKISPLNNTRGMNGSLPVRSIPRIWPASRSGVVGSDDVEVLDARGDVPVLRFLGVQLDLQAQVVHAVCVPERVLVADLARLEQVEQRLIEGLHAELARLLLDLLDLVQLVLEDQVGNERGVEHDLDRGAAALAFLQGDEALRNEPPQIERQVHQQLRAPLLGEEVDDAIQGLVGAVRVQRREAQVAGLGEGKRVIHRLAVADLADQDDVGRLAQRVLERG